MRIKITLADMATPLAPTVVAWFIVDTDILEYPLMHNFPLPASVDARVQHPYAIQIERISR